MHEHTVDVCILVLFIATFLILPILIFAVSWISHVDTPMWITRAVFPSHLCSALSLTQLSKISITMLNRRGDSTLVLFLNFEGKFLRFYHGVWFLPWVFDGYSLSVKEIWENLLLFSFLENNFAECLSPFFFFLF